MSLVDAFGPQLLNPSRREDGEEIIRDSMVTAKTKKYLAIDYWERIGYKWSKHDLERIIEPDELARL